jgi:RNA polymerase sigma-70 factor (ECF subfamily)
VQDATVATDSGDQVVAGESWSSIVRGTYDEVRGPLWRALLAWSGSPDVADEAVAEAFAQLLGRGPEVRDPSAWVWRSAFRIGAGDLHRRRTIEGRASDRDLNSQPSVVDRLPDDALDLVAALAHLSEQQRQCVALVDVAGHTAPSAAAVLGTTAATVRVQLMRGRRRLRSLLEDAAIESVADTDAPDDAEEPS